MNIPKLSRQAQIVTLWAKASKIKSITNISELTTLYKQKISEKLADIGYTTDPDAGVITLNWLNNLADLANTHEANGNHGTKNFIRWLLPKATEAMDFVFVADTEEEAAGALKCWAISKDWENPEGEAVLWADVVDHIWEG